ncbi:hypothetical protein R3P38DRAFT_3304955 [Favolaschia claudopus]|uniref:Uncharacterized protein n=1 Tax=Favolaschia claudopus TaxID=2862362 RepID=A0AAW0DY59_9AGAR
MKFLATLFALMAIASVTAAPTKIDSDKASVKGLAASKAAKAKAAKGKGSKASSSVNNANSTATVDNSAANNASSTSTAASATRTRVCDQGDQSLAAGLQAAVPPCKRCRNATAAADFADGQTRLQQFVDTMALQLQMATTIADDGSFAQTQLKLTAQTTLVKGLAGGDVKTSANTLTQLAQSFLDSTNNAQDGASQALIDCFLPLNVVSG